MSSERDGRRSGPPRVLPSVDVALLPHERRAARAKVTAVFGLIAVGLLGTLAWAFGPATIDWWQARPASVVPEDTDDGWPEPQQPATPPPPGTALAGLAAAEAEASDTSGTPAPALALAVPEVAPQAQAGRTVERPFGKARGFRDAIRNAGVSATDADAIVVALTPHVDFRRCRPEHRLRITTDGAGQLQWLEYQTARTDLYRATRTADGFSGEKVTIEVVYRRIAKGGHIAGSLGQALVHNGLGRSLVGAFVEVFERKVSFTRDTRQGDSFRIIVDEKYVDGEFLGYGTVHAVEYTGQRVGRLRGFWFQPGEAGSDAVAGDFFDVQGRAVNGGWLRTPLRYDHISSPFDPKRMHPVLKRVVPHQGVDYAAASGTPIWAAAAGTVMYAGYKGANGNLIALRHNNGFETYYAHLSRISKGLKRGVKVRQRQPIGAVGTTGRSTGPHLHFALKRRGRFIDPMRQLNGPGKPLPSRQLGRYREVRRGLEQELAAIPLQAAPDPDAPDPAADTSATFHEEGSL